MPLSAKREDQPHAALRGRLSRCRKRDRSLVRKFHRIVGEIFQRCAQAQSIARHHRRQIVGDLDLGLEILVVGTRRQRRADSLGKRARRKRLVAKSEPMGLGLGGIDDQRGQRRKVVGAAFDRARPFALARAQIGRREQFGKRHDAGQWRADIVRDAGKRGLDRAR